MKTMIKNIEAARAATFAAALTEAGYTFKTRDFLGKIVNFDIEYNPHHGDQSAIEFLLACAKA